MSKTAYHISLKGYVGGYDFDRSTVDRELAKNEGKQVNVLIDSLGGSLATGLSISAAFRNHGNVKNHGEIFVLFVFLNASVASIICSVYTLSGITRVIYQKSPQNHSIPQIFTIQIISSFKPCPSAG